MLLKTIFIFTIILVAAKAQQNTGLINYYNTQNSSFIRNDEYIEVVRQQNDFHIWYYTHQIESFRDVYLNRINSIGVQQKLLMGEISRANEMLMPLTVLSDFSRECVEKYKNLIPSETAAKSEVERCMVTGRGQVNSLINSMVSTNQTLSTYYVGTFEKGVTNCRSKFNASNPLNYVQCLAEVVSASNVYTVDNQRIFSAQLELAKGSANVYVKQAQDCSFSVQNSTISNIRSAANLIDLCLNETVDENPDCEGYCEKVLIIPASMIDPNSTKMANPFFGRNETGECLTFDIWDL